MALAHQRTARHAIVAGMSAKESNKRGSRSGKDRRPVNSATATRDPRAGAIHRFVEEGSKYPVAVHVDGSEVGTRRALEKRRIGSVHATALGIAGIKGELVDLLEGRSCQCLIGGWGVDEVRARSFDRVNILFVNPHERSVVAAGGRSHTLADLAELTARTFIAASSAIRRIRSVIRQQAKKSGEWFRSRSDGREDDAGGPWTVHEQFMDGPTGAPEGTCQLVHVHTERRIAVLTRCVIWA